MAELSESDLKRLRHAIIDEIRSLAANDKEFREVVEPLGFFSALALVDGLVAVLASVGDSTPA